MTDYISAKRAKRNNANIWITLSNKLNYVLTNERSRN